MFSDVFSCGGLRVAVVSLVVGVHVDSKSEVALRESYTEGSILLRKDDKQWGIV